MIYNYLKWETELLAKHKTNSQTALDSVRSIVSLRCMLISLIFITFKFFVCWIVGDSRLDSYPGEIVFLISNTYILGYAGYRISNWILIFGMAMVIQIHATHFGYLTAIVRTPFILGCFGTIMGPSGILLFFIFCSPMLLHISVNPPPPEISNINYLLLDFLSASMVVVPSFLMEDQVQKTLQRLEEAKTAAETLATEKTGFLRKVCHELRTPFSGVLGYLELLSTILSPQRDVHGIELLQSAVQCCENLMTTVNTVLNLEYVSSEITNTKDICNIADLLKSSTALLAKFFLDKNVELIVKICEGTPALIMANKCFLEQTFTNLVHNAIKFTEAGVVTIKVSVISKHKLEKKNQQAVHPKYLQFRVKDTGIGIKAEDMNKIFLPFSQIQRDDRGSGLGLSLVKQFVTNLGGLIFVESTYKVGSSFIVCIPLLTPEDPCPYPARQQFFPFASFKKAIAASKSEESKKCEVPHTEKESQTLNFEVQNEKKTVLLAEDNLLNQKMFASMIGKHGVKVDVANNGKEAFEFFLKSTYDCVFMDLEMPVQNGYDTTKQIRELSKEIPVIVITAHSTQEDRDFAFACGATDFVVKPISTTTMKSVLEKYSIIPIHSCK